MKTESMISTSDEELLTIPGVDISFVKKLRKTIRERIISSTKLVLKMFTLQNIR